MSLKSGPLGPKPVRPESLRPDPLRSGPPGLEPSRLEPLGSDPLRSDPLKSGPPGLEALGPKSLGPVSHRPDPLRPDPLRPDPLGSVPLSLSPPSPISEMLRLSFLSLRPQSSGGSQEGFLSVTTPMDAATTPDTVSQSQDSGFFVPPAYNLTEELTAIRHDLDVFHTATSNRINALESQLSLSHCTQELETAQEKIAELEFIIEQLQRQRLVEENHELKIRVESLQKALELEVKDLRDPEGHTKYPPGLDIRKALEDQISSLKEDLDFAIKAKEVLEAYIKELEDQEIKSKKDFESKTKGLEAQALDLQETLSSLTKTKNGLETRVLSLEEALDAETKAKEKFEALVKELDKNYLKEHRAKNEIALQLHSLQKVFSLEGDARSVLEAELRTSLDSMNKAKSSLEAEVIRLKEALKSEIKARRALEHNITNLEERSKMADKAKMDLEAEVSGLKKSFEAKDTILDLSTKDKTALESKLSALEDTNQKLQKTIQNQSKQIQEVQKKNKIAAFEKSQAKCTQQAKEIDRLKAETLDVARQLKEALNGQLAAHKDHQKALKESLKWQKAHNHLQEHLESMRDGLEEDEN